MTVAATPGEVARAVRGAEAFGARRVAELDRAEEFPGEACRLLDTLGVPRWYVPARFGGALTDHSGLIRIVRAVAGHDLTAAVAHVKTFLGAAPVFVAAQQSAAESDEIDRAHRLGARIRDGLVVSWGLTEREHGSDLLAGELTATPDAGGYRLNGTKWPINNATRAEAICLLARTSPGGGARGFSLLFVDKHQLSPREYRHLPKVLTHGIRGADISGVEFTDALVAEDALVGRMGTGLATVMKTLQLTRIIASALSLGALDHALRLSHRYASRRWRHDRYLIDVPHVRRTLGTVAAGVFVAECLTLFAGRAVHALPGELSIYSAVTKTLVPALADELIAECAELLGARAFLTSVDECGAFAKLQRDHRIVGIFDGNMFVNRSALIGQFPRLGVRWRQRVRDSDRVWAAADLTAPLPVAGGLELISHDGCSLMQDLPATVDGLRAAGAPPRVVSLAGQIVVGSELLHTELAALPPQGVKTDAEAFELAHRYELYLAAATVTTMWMANRQRCAQPWWRDALWLEAALTFLADRLSPPGYRPDPRPLDRMVDCLDGLAVDRPIGLDTGSEVADG